MQYKRQSIRLKEYDYSNNGAYFITICTHNRECLFGKIVSNTIGAGSKPALMSKPAPMILNDMGQMVEYTWHNLLHHNSGIELDEYVIMPNHFHGIIKICLNSGSGLESMARAGLEPAPTVKCYGLPEIVRQFKTFSSKRINTIRNMPGHDVWQRNYYERVIRNDRELNQIREYIMTNPIHWEMDKEYKP